MEQTFFIVKPDAMQHNKLGEIISIIEKNNFKIVDLKMIKANEELLKLHYKELVNKDFFPKVVSFMTETPVVVGILEKENAVSEWRKLIGVTNSLEAEKGTVRNLFGTDKTRNAVHGSASIEEAKNEIKIWLNK